MRRRPARKAAIGIPVGVLLAGASVALSFQEMTPVPFRVVLLLAGIAVYLWGCAALAEAKGYSSAIVLTFIFGLLLPAVLLVVLPDKNAHCHRRHRG